MDKSQPDRTRPLPETAELGGEGGSFGESTSRESRRSGGRAPRPDTTVTDIACNVTRLSEVEQESTPPAGKDVKKYPA